MTTLTQLSAAQSQKEVAINENFASVAPAGAFAYDPANTTGLTFHYFGGYVRSASGAMTAVAAGTVALTASATNYVEMDPATNGISKNTAGFSAGAVPLCVVTTGTGAVTAVTDYRQFVNPHPLRSFVSLSVAGGADVTLTADQARADFIELTGAITANISVIVPTKRREHVIKNSTTGNYSLTVKTDAGTGVKLAQGDRRVLICDGTNVADATGGPRVRNFGNSGAGGVTVDFTDVDVAVLTLTGNATITLTGGVPGQACRLVLIQDANGSRTPTFGAEVRFGTDIASVTYTATASKQDKIGFIFNDDGAGKYDVVAVSRGF